MFTRQDLILGSHRVKSNLILAFDGAAASTSARGGAPRTWRTGMDKKNKNQNKGSARATNHPKKKNPRTKSSGKTRPDRPADQKATPDRKDHDPGRVPRRPKSNPLDELFASEEFKADLAFIAERVEESAGNDSQIGERASKWIGDRRYSRELNPKTFAEQLKRETGCKRSGRQIKNYIDAYQERQFHEKSGKRFPYFDVSHLAQLAACCRGASDEDRLKLAQRANDNESSVREIKQLAQRLNAETVQARRILDLVPIESKVMVVEAHDLLLEQEDGSIECGILDWQWSPREWGRSHDYPKVYTPEDPVTHLCRCLEILKQKLSPVGSIFLFHTPVGFLDPRIPETCNRIGFKHAGKLIWQKTCGGFQDADTMLRVGHEEIHILSHEGYKPKAINGGTNSVTPKWGAPTHATSGEQHNAVHRHQKPVALMELLIWISTVNGLVADPFAGSGSAGMAAVRLGCSYVGSELMPEIAESANRRIALAHGENDEVVEAVNFFMASASEEQYRIISSALEKCNLRCVCNPLGGLK